MINPGFSTPVLSVLVHFFIIKSLLHIRLRGHKTPYDWVLLERIGKFDLGTMYFTNPTPKKLLVLIFLPFLKGGRGDLGLPKG